MNVVLILIAGTGSLLVGALLANHPPLQGPPGRARRLQTYLTTNVAETRRDHCFPELELRCYPLPPEVLLARADHAITTLNWELTELDTKRRRLHAVITSPLFKFKDDMDIRVVPAGGCTELHVRSRSRIGRADLGANTRHILDLLEALEQQA